MPAHTNAWNESSPAGSDLASSIDDFMRQMKLDMRERLALQHYWNAATAVGNNQDGTHKEITLTPATTNTPLLKTNANQSLTGSDASAGVDLGITWNTSGAPAAIKVNVTNTASGAASKFLDFQVGGTTQFKVDKTGKATVGDGTTSGDMVVLNGAAASAKSVVWQNNGAVTARVFSFNSEQYWDGAGVWRLRTIAEVTKFEVNQLGEVTAQGHITSTGNVISGGVHVANASSAAITSYGFATDQSTGPYLPGVGRYGISTGGTARWEFDASGHFKPAVDNTYDIGTSGLRVRTLHVNSISTGTATVGGTINIPKGSLFSFATDLDTGIGSDADNNINLVGGGSTVFGATNSAGRLTCNIPTAAMGTGAVTGGYLEIGRNSSGNGAPGVLTLRAENGTAYVLWVDTSGKLRIHTATPTEDNSVPDTAGTVVGTQV